MSLLPANASSTSPVSFFVITTNPESMARASSSFEIAFAVFAYTVFAAALIWAAVVDVRTRLVPQASLITGLVMWVIAVIAGLVWDACPFLFAFGRDGAAWLGESIVGGLLSGGLSLLCAVILERRSGRMALGGGDVKLFFVVGLYLGPAGGLLALGLSSVLAVVWQVCIAVGSVIAALHAQWRKSRSDSFDSFDNSSNATLHSLRHLRNKAFPFVPFIALSAAITSLLLALLNV